MLKDYSYRIQPWLSDYMKDRKWPLEVTVLCGNVTHPDHHLKEVDAVIAIELSVGEINYIDINVIFYSLGCYVCVFASMCTSLSFIFSFCLIGSLL